MKRYIQAKIEILPFTKQDWIVYGNKLAEDMGLNDTKWAVEMRAYYTSELFSACMRNVRPQGFKSDWARIECQNVYSRFHTQEIKVDLYCPGNWVRELKAAMINAFEDYEFKYIKLIYG